MARFALEELQAIGVADCLAGDVDDDADSGFTAKPWVLSGPDTDLIRRVLRPTNTRAPRGTKSGKHPPNPPKTRAREEMF